MFRLTPQRRTNWLSGLPTSRACPMALSLVTQHEKHPRFRGNGGVALSHKDVLPQLKSRTPKGCSLLRRTEERIGCRASRSAERAQWRSLLCRSKERIGPGHRPTPTTDFHTPSVSQRPVERAQWRSLLCRTKERIGSRPCRGFIDCLRENVNSSLPGLDFYDMMHTTLRNA